MSLSYSPEDLQDFFAENHIALPPEVQPATAPGDDKFAALKKMMLSTLDRVQAQAQILHKEAMSAEATQESVAKILEKMAFVNKSFS